MSTDALSISVYGSPGTTEYQAAIWLRDMIKRGTLPVDSGTVSIHTDVYFSGQKREQIDILLHAHFPSGFSRKVRLLYSLEPVDVTFLDIIAVIEVKAHSGEKVRFSSVNAEVLYRDDWKSASAQSNAQIHSVKQLIRHQLKWTPYVCNLIYFPNLQKADFPSSPNNYLALDSTFDDLLEKLCIAKRLVTSGARSGSLRFCCVSAQLAETIAERHKQLESLLGNHKHEVRYQPPSAVRNWASSTRYRGRPSFFRTFNFRRRRSSIFFKLLSNPIGKAMIFLLIAGGVVHLLTGTEFRRESDSTIAVSSASAPKLATCDFVTPGCGCDASTRFRKGTIAYVRFFGAHQKPVSEVIRDPQGRVSTLTFHDLHLSPKYFDGSCFVAKYVIGRQAVPGPYSVQVTSQLDGSRSQGVFSGAFEVMH